MRVRFQFTHPGRGATVTIKQLINVLRVSIHAPREGCDDAISCPLQSVVAFQFTHPGRGAT